MTYLELHKQGCNRAMERCAFLIMKILGSGCLDSFPNLQNWMFVGKTEKAFPKRGSHQIPSGVSPSLHIKGCIKCSVCLNIPRLLQCWHLCNQWNCQSLSSSALFLRWTINAYLEWFGFCHRHRLLRCNFSQLSVLILWLDHRISCLEAP